MKKRMFIGSALLIAGLVSGCTVDPSVVDSPDKVHDPITIFSASLTISLTKCTEATPK